MLRRTCNFGLILASILLANYASSANSKDPLNLGVPVGDFGPKSPNWVQVVDDCPVVHDYRTAQNSRWIGTYEPLTHESCHIKKLVFTERNNGSLKVQVWMSLDTAAGAASISETPIETKAKAFRDGNVKSVEDTVIADFKEAQFKPLLVITRGSPILPGNLQKYQYVTYTCYLSGYRGNCYIRGRLDRRDGSKHD